MTLGTTTDDSRRRCRALSSGGVQQFRAQATDSFGKLEKMFEERLAKTLKGIGVPTARDVSQLSRRVAELDRHVAALTRGNGAKRAKSKARR